MRYEGERDFSAWWDARVQCGSDEVTLAVRRSRISLYAAGFLVVGLVGLRLATTVGGYDVVNLHIPRLWAIVLGSYFVLVGLVALPKLLWLLVSGGLGLRVNDLAVFLRIPSRNRTVAWGEIVDFDVNDFPRGVVIVRRTGRKLLILPALLKLPPGMGVVELADRLRELRPAPPSGDDH